MTEIINSLNSALGHKLGNIISVTRLDGGTVNQTYKVSTQKGDFVVRINKLDQINVFKKEVYCYQKAKELQIPSPNIIELFQELDHCILITQYIPGLSNKNIDNKDIPYVWRKLGEYSQLSAKVRQLEYGEDAQNTNDAKSKYIKNMLDTAITEFSKMDDYFIINKIFSPSEITRVLELFNILKNKIEDIDFGLIHGDLSLSNVVLNEDGIVYLIDWGSANLMPTPYFQVMLVYLESILKESFKSDYQAEFLKGNGLEEDFINKNIDIINAISLLNLTDKIRWAIDNNKHEALKSYSKKLEKSKNHLLMS
jgi:fructosamine-3-kinase